MDLLNDYLDKHEPDLPRDGALVEKYFDLDQRTKLWNAFKRKRDASTDESRRCYGIVQARDRSNRDRTNLMALALFQGKNRPWEDVIQEYAEKYEETHRKEGTKEWLTKGELEQKHGKKEARQLISQGHFETKELADGTAMFQKKTFCRIILEDKDPNTLVYNERRYGPGRMSRTC